MTIKAEYYRGIFYYDYVAYYHFYGFYGLLPV